MAFIAPERFSEPLVQARFALELSRNEQLQLEPEARKTEALAALRQSTVERLRYLRRALVVSLVSTASALAVAFFFRATAIAPMLPRPLLAVGSILSFASATLLYFGRHRTRTQRAVTVLSFRPRLLHVLYWIGVCWAALAIF